MCSSKRPGYDNCGSRSINIDVIESFVWQRFFADKQLSNILKQHLQNTDTDKRLIEIKSEIERLNKELRSNTKKENKAVKLVIEGVLTQTQVTKELNSLKQEKEYLQSEISRLDEDIKAYNKIINEAEFLINDLDKIKTDTTFNKKKELISEYINYIKVTDKKDASLFLLNVSFNIIGLDEEEYLLMYPEYYFALEVSNGIFIPLNKMKKNITEEQKRNMANAFYRAAELL